MTRSKGQASKGLVILSGIGAPLARLDRWLSGAGWGFDFGVQTRRPDWMGIYTSTAVGGLMAGVDTGFVCAAVYWLVWRFSQEPI